MPQRTVELGPKRARARTVHLVLYERGLPHCREATMLHGENERGIEAILAVDGNPVRVKRDGSGMERATWHRPHECPRRREDGAE